MLKQLLRNRWAIVLFMTIFLYSSYNHLIAQESSGQIAGTIVDAQNGETLIGANVYLDQTTLGAASDLDGSYVILNVPDGKYTLIVSVVGYAETIVEGSL